MRYKNGENVAVAGILPEGATVTIKVLDLLTDSLVTLSSSSCSESSVVPGLYIWNSANISDVLTGFRTMFYQMSDGTNEVQGKFVYGGYIDDMYINISAMNGKIDGMAQSVWEYTI